MLVGCDASARSDGPFDQVEDAGQVVGGHAGREARDEAVEDEPEELESRAQDLFCEFVAHGTCVQCGQLVRFTDFGKL